jgi:putative oxidoreductase
LIVGFGFMEHGYAKIVRGPEHFAGILAAMGVPGPHLMSWMTILVELVGGLAVLLGVFVPVFAVPMAAILVVAALTVHLPNGFSSIKLLSVSPSGAYFGQPGYETDLLYLSCLAALALGGSGALSIEAWLHRVRTSRA